MNLKNHKNVNASNIIEHIKILYNKISNSTDGITNGIQSIQAGTNITIDNTDPANPIINAGGSQDLQSVTDIGNITTNSIFSVSDTPISAVMAQNVNGAKAYIRADGSEGVLSLNNVTTGKQVLLKINNTNPPILFNPTTTYLPFSNNLTLVSQITDGTTIVTADDEGKVDLSTLSLGGGNFIPLSGTEVGSPVTGNIEINSLLYSGNNNSLNLNNKGDIILKAEDGANRTDLKINTSEAVLRRDSAGDAASIRISNSTGQNQIEVSNNHLLARGIIGIQDFTANAQALDFVQKKYVDDNFLSSVPDLQVVTDAGSITTNSIESQNVSGAFTRMNNFQFRTENSTGTAVATVSPNAVAVSNTTGALKYTQLLSDELFYYNNTFGIYIKASPLTANRAQTFQDKSGTIALTSDIAATADSGTTVLAIDNVFGTLYDMASANSATTYTTTGTVLNAYAKVLINTTSEPTVTGATKIAGATWVTGTDMYMVVNYNGNRMEYYFLEI